VTTKTDNFNLPAKLQLRRYFLYKFHRDPKTAPMVFDCCQAEGVIWSNLRKEFEVMSYWGVDLKPKKGRLKIDSARVLNQPGWPFNVIDIDTYGSPWTHWFATLKHLTRPASVFLTIGIVRMGGGGGLAKEAQRIMGLTGLDVPQGIQGRLHDLALQHCLGAAADYKLEVVEAIEAVSTGNARYFGIHLRPVEFR
jgi:hypothetical protein